MLNYEPPQSHAIYLHRVGRTARAGLSGRACTLVAESDRKIVREIVRAAKAQGTGTGSGSGPAKVVSRVLDPDALDRCDGRIAALADEIDAILSMEKEERAMGEAERDVRRGENLVGFSDEIASRPRRTWFAGERDKQQARERGAKELNGADPNGAAPAAGKRTGTGKMSGKQKKRLDDRKLRTGEVGGHQGQEGSRRPGEGRIWKKPKSGLTVGAQDKGKKGKEKKKTGTGGGKKGGRSAGIGNVGRRGDRKSKSRSASASASKGNNRGKKKKSG